MLISEDGKPVYIYNRPMRVLIKAMNAESFDQPQPIIVDESGYTQPVDINLGPINIKNVTAVNHALTPYGLKLLYATRLLDMVIVTDTQYYDHKKKFR